MGLDGKTLSSIQVSRNLLKLKLCNSELDFSVLVFVTQFRGLKELVLTGNSFYGSRDIVTLGVNHEGITTIEALEENDTMVPLQANYNLQSLAIYKNSFDGEDIQLSLFSKVIPCLKALRHLIIPSNGFKSPGVARQLSNCLTSTESGFPGHLESLNIGNNLFSPGNLLSLCRVALVSGKVPRLKKLVIAFSDLGSQSE